jgi:hypothetical protein
MIDFLDPIFLSLYSLVFFETIFIFYLIFKTPALKFMLAGLRHRIILIHPKENHYIDFVPAKQQSSLAYVKGRGYYLINPKHVYIEGTGKIPCAIVYGNYPINLTPEAAATAEELKKMGINFYDELQDAVNKVKNDLWPKGKSIRIQLFGKSVDISETLSLFSTGERSDLIEAEIQRRTAAQVIQKLRTPENWFKWAMIAIIVIIGLVIAYGMLTSITGHGGLPSPMEAIQGAARVISPIPTNATGVVVK